ncbi:hypothetical protein HS041_28955 [Planomonospora sp. ID67723]|nr:hypothetical protein [Planomonospora sp. ID67723]
MNVQVLAAPDGTILWTSGALPGKVHDLSAARIWGILRMLERAGIVTLAGKTSDGRKSQAAAGTVGGKASVSLWCRRLWRQW